MQIQFKKTWISEIHKYLKTRVEPKDKMKRRKLKNQAARYTLIERALYKMLFIMPYLRCLSERKVKYAMREFYEGICDNHLEAKRPMN